MNWWNSNLLCLIISVRVESGWYDLGHQYRNFLENLLWWGNLESSKFSIHSPLSLYPGSLHHQRPGRKCQDACHHTQGGRNHKGQRWLPSWQILNIYICNTTIAVEIFVLYVTVSQTYNNVSLPVQPNPAYSQGGKMLEGPPQPRLPWWEEDLYHQII